MRVPLPSLPLILLACAGTLAVATASLDNGSVNAPLQLEFDYDGDGTWQPDPDSEEPAALVRVTGQSDAYGTWWAPMSRFVVESPEYFVDYPNREFFQAPTPVDLSLHPSYGPDYAGHPDLDIGIEALDQFLDRVKNPQSDLDLVNDWSIPLLSVQGQVNADSSREWDARYHRFNQTSLDWWERTMATPNDDTRVINMEFLARQCIETQWVGEMPAKWFLSEEWNELTNGTYSAGVMLQAVAVQDAWCIAASYPSADVEGEPSPDTLIGWYANADPPVVNLSGSGMHYMSGLMLGPGNGGHSYTADGAEPVQAGELFWFQFAGVRGGDEFLVAQPGGGSIWAEVEDADVSEVAIRTALGAPYGLQTLIAVRHQGGTAEFIPPLHRATYFKYD